MKIYSVQYLNGEDIEYQDLFLHKEDAIKFKKELSDGGFDGHEIVEVIVHESIQGFHNVNITI